jgi:lysylphosphatidylglycerol synthetase-like protein (DUF2156 family)
MDKSIIVAGIVIAADIFIAGYVYYITPYHKHFLVPEATSFNAQPTIATLCAIMGVICIIAAIVILLKWPAKTKKAQKK